MPAHDERQAVVARRIDEQRSLQEREHPLIDRRAGALAGADERARNRQSIGVAHVEITDVGAIHLEARGHFGERRGELTRREITRVAVEHRQRRQLLAEGAHLAGEQLVDHLLLSLICDVRERLPDAGECAIERIEPRKPLAVDEDVVDRRQKVVAGRSAHRKRVRQLFVVDEDLLDDDVDGVRRAQCAVRR